VTAGTILVTFGAWVQSDHSPSFPGDERTDLAFVFARDYTSPDTLASVTKLMQMIDIVRNAFITNTLPGGGRL